MRKFFLIAIVIFVFVFLLASCSNINATRISTLESENAQLKAKSSETSKATETTVAETNTAVKETTTESSNTKVKKEFSLSMAGNLYISGYTPTVWVEGDYAYLTSGNSFKIVDISDKKNPKILGSIGMDIAGGYIGNDFCVKDNYAYIPYQVYDQKTNTTKDSGFQVIDISDKKNLKIVGEYKAKGEIINILVVDKYVYVAFTVREFKDNNYKVLESGFQIVDIIDKGKPNLVGKYSSKSQNGIGAVCVDGNIAYISDNGYLKIIDVTDKDNLIGKGNLYLPIWPNFLYFKDNYLYAPLTNALEIIDVSDKEKPTLVGGVFSKGNISKIFVLEDSVYIAYSIYLYSENNREVVESGLQIMDLKSSKPLGEVKVNGEARGVFVSGDYAYVATGPTGLQIVKLFNE
ncbi:MAG: LVIVD repeat-containing protein [Candidatus Humimicrobiaceae bacterium]